MDNTWTFFILLALAAAGLMIFFGMRRVKYEQSIRKIREYAFPDFLYAKLQQQLPDISKQDYALICQGLRQFLQACNYYRDSSIRIPSHTADLLWHEFILCNRYYEEFCEDIFNGLLHHRPKYSREAAQQDEENLLCCWLIACAEEGISARQPERMPVLFALDQRFSPPQAILWEVEEGRLLRRQAGQEACVYPFLRPVQRMRSTRKGGDFDAVCCES